MTSILNFLGSHPMFGFINAVGTSLGATKLSQGVIPDGVEEVVAFSGVVMGAIIAFLTIVGMVRKEYRIYKGYSKPD